MMKYLGPEYWYAFVGIMLGLAVSAALAPKNSWFLPNAAFFWGSQLAVLAMLLMLWPRPAVVGGVAAALAIYLAAFGTWLFTRRGDPGASMAWNVYVLSLPGAAIGAIAIGFWQISARDLDSILADVHLRFICFGGRCNQPGDNLGYALVLEITEFPRITLRSMRATALPRPDSQPAKSNRPAQVCAGGVGREFLADRAVRAIHLHVAEIAPEPAALAGL